MTTIPTKVPLMRDVLDTRLHERIKDGLSITNKNASHWVFSDENKKRKRTKISNNSYTIVKEHFFLGNKNGKILHYINGPAQITYRKQSNTTFVRYYINGFYIGSTELYCNLSGFDEQETMLWVLKYGDNLPSVMEGDFYDLE